MVVIIKTNREIDIFNPVLMFILIISFMYITHTIFI